LIQAWASHKSFVRKDGKDDNSSSSNNDLGADFKGQTRSNDTHESSTDADARLYRKGKTASELRFMGHTLSDNNCSSNPSTIYKLMPATRSRQWALCAVLAG
jgi:hypothetical protein